MARKDWSREEVFRLIALFEDEDILWNTQSIEYRNREKKQRVVEEIALKFNCTVNEVQRKWHNLRNQVSQELSKMRKKKSGSGASGNYVSNWPYFSALKFLIPVVTACSTQSNVAFQEGREEGKLEVIIEEDGDAVNTSGHRKRKTPPAAEEEELFKCALQALQKQHDDCDIFGQYVASEIRNLKSDFNKKRLRSEIRKAIARIADEDDHCFSSTSSFSPSSEYSVPPIIFQATQTTPSDSLEHL